MPDLPGSHAHPGGPDGLDGRAAASEAVLTLIAEWQQADGTTPDRWTATTVPDFLSALYTALDALPPGSADPWQDVRTAVLASRRWPPSPPGTG